MWPALGLCSWLLLGWTGAALLWVGQCGPGVALALCTRPHLVFTVGAVVSAVLKARPPAASVPAKPGLCGNRSSLLASVLRLSQVDALLS